MKYIKMFEYKRRRRTIITDNPIEYSGGSDEFDILEPNKLNSPLFYEYDSMKFHVGDIVIYVGYDNEEYGKDRYKVVAVELPYYGNQNYRIEGHYSSWVSEDEIKKVPDYELDAEKYNL